MATSTPTAPTFSTLISATSYATATTPYTRVTLDLTTKDRAVLIGRIGRNVATALTRPARIAIRRTDNNSMIHPADTYDMVSTTAAVTATTVSSGGAAAAQTVTLASGTGFTAGSTTAAPDDCCAQLAGARCEFFKVLDVTGAVVTIDNTAGFKVSHNASDVVTNGANIFSVTIPGGDIWEFIPLNNSGQTVIMSLDAIVYNGDTIV